ncbi:RnfH family protein [Pigmentiphaga aceris]|uniref:UPF0125 protein FXN63_11065 n=1 Tax=Pigmentiphaga aceris TaxID=1940612 RepID=A0A5C0B0E8_9BURK|nr:RnfH family protein [Pigmentiphaga aceris]QEI06311.1 RnfH family protein [Pigmentiphaga aceris]
MTVQPDGGAAGRRATRGSISQSGSVWVSALTDPAVRNVAQPDVDAPALLVSLCYVWPEGSWTQSVRMPPGAVVAQAVWLSGFLTEFPNIDLSTGGIGIFGQLCGPYEVLEDGDRLEVYRALHFDPQESRFRRVQHKLKQQRREKFGPR